MKFILGGAYQGKLSYARSKYDLSDADIFNCTDTQIDFSKPCIHQLEEFSYACVKADIDAVEYMKRHRKDWIDSILICQDISSGVVPIEAEMRAWRRMNGRLCQYLSEEAGSVVRIFCGLEQKLK